MDARIIVLFVFVFIFSSCDDKNDDSFSAYEYLCDGKICDIEDAIGDSFPIQRGKGKVLEFIKEHQGSGKFGRLIINENGFHVYNFSDIISSDDYEANLWIVEYRSDWEDALLEFSFLDDRLVEVRWEKLGWDP